MTRAVVEQQHTVAVDGGQTQQQFRAAEQGAQPVLQPEKAFVGDDRFPVDEVALEGRQHLLVGHLHRPEDREPADEELLGRQGLTQPDRIEQVRVQMLAHLVAERRDAVPGHHLLESPIEKHPEMALEAGVGIGHCADQRVIDIHLDPVQPAQYQGVGVAHPHHRHHGRVQVDPRADRARLVHQQALHERGGVKPAQLEGEHGRAVFLLPGSAREHRCHQDVDQFAVALDHAGVLDGAGQLGCSPNQVRDDAGDGCLGGALGRHGAGPVGDQGLQTHLAAEREVVGTDPERGLDVGEVLALGVCRERQVHITCVHRGKCNRQGRPRSGASERLEGGAGCSLSCVRNPRDPLEAGGTCDITGWLERQRRNLFKDGPACRPQPTE